MNPLDGAFGPEESKTVPLESKIKEREVKLTPYQTQRASEIRKIIIDEAYERGYGPYVVGSHPSGDKLFLVVANEVYYRIEQDFLNDSDMLRLGEKFATGSDEDVIDQYDQIVKGDFKFMTSSEISEERQKRASGGFVFKVGYPAGLEKYGLFQTFEKKNYYYSCFLTAIKHACNPTEAQMVNLKIMTKGRLYIKTQ